MQANFLRFMEKALPTFVQTPITRWLVWIAAGKQEALLQSFNNHPQSPPLSANLINRKSLIEMQSFVPTEKEHTQCYTTTNTHLLHTSNKDHCFLLNNMDLKGSFRPK